MGKKAYVCSTCGAVAEEPGHLCNPASETHTCAYCGQEAPPAQHYCKGKMDDLRYVCQGCGRLAPSEHMLCKPKEVPTG